MAGQSRAHQGFARLGRILRAADEGNDLVDIGNRNGQANQNMGAVARLGEQELGAPGDDFLAEGDERLQQVLEVHQFRPAAGEADVVDAEGRLQRREAVELVQDDIGHGVALDLDDHAHAVAIALVADVGNAFEFLLAHQIGHALDHLGLVHLIGNLGDDQRLAVLAHFLGADLGPHDDGPTASVEGRLDADAAEDHGRRSENPGQE